MLAAPIPPRIIIPPRASSTPGSLSSKKWSELAPGEKIIVGSIGAVMLGALIFTAVTVIRT